MLHALPLHQPRLVLAAGAESMTGHSNERSRIRIASRQRVPRPQTIKARHAPVVFQDQQSLFGSGLFFSLPLLPPSLAQRRCLFFPSRFSLYLLLPLDFFAL